jgi:spermidine dehydrogenase
VTGRMKESDRKLGMGRAITRRDFIHDLAVSSMGFSLPGIALAGTSPPVSGISGNYPPTLTGLRGSHPGSFEVAHALAREGNRWDQAADADDKPWDLVVVGGGISGLAAAWFYRKLHGQDARILVIENHDDFGGHAKRNEYHQGGHMRLAWGGAINLEFPDYSDVALELLAELGVYPEKLHQKLEFDFTNAGELGTSVYFDAQTYGRDVLVPGSRLRYDENMEELAGHVDSFPLSEEARSSLTEFFLAGDDLLASMEPDQKKQFLRGTSYYDFLTRHVGLTTEAAQIFLHSTDGYWGVATDGLSVMEALGGGLPGAHRLGGFVDGSLAGMDDRFAMFPDGNASVARLLVRSLIPGVNPGDARGDIVTARFDYSKLDAPGSSVRLRLNSTAVEVVNRPSPEGDEQVAVTYVKGGQAYQVSAAHCVLACNNNIIPFMCPQLPQEQSEALEYQVRRPMITSNVLMRNARAAQKLGIASAYCPGRLHANAFLVTGVNSKEYHPAFNPEQPAVMQFFGSMTLPLQGMTPREQHRAGSVKMLELEFADYERELRTTLAGMLGPGGFDPAEDILAITVNRWPHGYAYDYLDLWDPQWPPGKAPNEIGRQRFGQIAIANSDAGADAYFQEAVDQAWRAVNDLGRS